MLGWRSSFTIKRDNQKDTWLLLNTNSICVRIWDVIVLGLTLVACYWIPFKITFHLDENYDLWKVRAAGPQGPLWSGAARDSNAVSLQSCGRCEV